MSTASEVARQVIHRHSKSFSLAARLLPPEQARDAVVLYAYCRAVDDAIDLSPPDQHRQALDRLKRELEGVYAGQSQPEPVLDALTLVVRRHGIPREYPEELLLGMQMDIAGQRYATLQDLLLYCYRVAGTVGLMMCHVLGASSPKARRHAAHLGIAMQLTNICRDVAEDARRGRLYLPEQLLHAHGSPPPDPVSRSWSAAERQAVAAVTLELLDLANLYYTSGEAGLRYLARPAANSVMLARLVYAEIGAVVRRNNADVRAGRAYVRAPRKAFLLAQAWLATRHLPATLSAQPLPVLGAREAIALGDTPPA